MIDGRDLWFPDYVWTGDVKEVDNTIIKDYAQSVLKEKAMLRALHIDDRPWKVADLNVEECLELKKLTEVITNDIHKICNEQLFPKDRTSKLSLLLMQLSKKK